MEKNKTYTKKAQNNSNSSVKKTTKNVNKSANKKVVKAPVKKSTTVNKKVDVINTEKKQVVKKEKLEEVRSNFIKDNPKEEKNKKKKILLILAFFVLLLILFIGITYSYFDVGTSFNGNLGNISSSIECINVSLSTEDLIMLENQHPVTDEYALENYTPVTITVTNHCTSNPKNTAYTLAISSFSDETGYIQDSQIRTKITRNLNNSGEEVIKNIDYLNTLTGLTTGRVYDNITNYLNKRNDTKDFANKTSYIIDSASIGNGQTNIYKVYLWIDYYEGDTTQTGLNNNLTQGKSFKSLISLISNVSDSTINYHSNYGEDVIITEQYLDTDSITLRGNTFVRENYIFGGWNTEPDGSGTTYADEEVISSASVTTLDLYAIWAEGPVEMNGVYYQTLQSAINAASGTGKRIKLLANISEVVTVGSSKNIILDFQKFTLSRNESTSAIINNSGTITFVSGTIKNEVSSVTNPIIENNGTFTMAGGLLTSNGNAACINNNPDSNVYLNGGEVIATGTRQAIYNNGGNVEISGDVHLESSISLVDKNRGTVQNLTGGTLSVTSGTIISNAIQPAIFNEGTMTIGTQGGSLSDESPLIKGEKLGINSTTNYSMYDGIIKGKEYATNDDTKIATVESGYYAVHGIETVNQDKYDTIYLGDSSCSILFNANKESLTNITKNVECGGIIGVIPTLTVSDATLIGWYTENVHGNAISEQTVVNNNMEVFAHWADGIVYVDGTYYKTLQAAINSVTGSQATTIEVLNDVTENVTISSGKNIILDVGNYSLSRTATNTPVITNNGTLTLINGTVKNTYSNSTKPVIENYGTFYMTGGRVTSNGGAACVNTQSNASTYISGGEIIATGTRQAAYNYGNGLLEISGDAYLSSAIKTTDKTRATIQNLANGVLNIKGGTIIATGVQPAVFNEGVMTIGVQGGNVSITTPLMQSETVGIRSSTNFSMYDGIVKSIGNAFNDETKITGKETGYSIAHGTDGDYNTAYLSQ